MANVSVSGSLRGELIAKTETTNIFVVQPLDNFPVEGNRTFSKAFLLDVGWLRVEGDARRRGPRRKTERNAKIHRRSKPTVTLYTTGFFVLFFEQPPPKNSFKRRAHDDEGPEWTPIPHKNTWCNMNHAETAVVGR